MAKFLDIPPQGASFFFTPRRGSLFPEYPTPDYPTLPRANVLLFRGRRTKRMDNLAHFRAKGRLRPPAPLGGPIFSHAPTSPLFFDQFSPPRPNLTAIGPPYTPTQTLSHTCQNCFSSFFFAFPVDCLPARVEAAASYPLPFLPFSIHFGVAPNQING